MVQWRYELLPGAAAMRKPIRSGDQQFTGQLPPPLLRIASGYVDNRIWLGVNAGFEWDTNPIPLFLGGG